MRNLSVFFFALREETQAFFVLFFCSSRCKTQTSSVQRLCECKLNDGAPLKPLWRESSKVIFSKNSECPPKNNKEKSFFFFEMMLIWDSFLIILSQPVKPMTWHLKRLSNGWGATAILSASQSSCSSKAKQQKQLCKGASQKYLM